MKVVCKTIEGSGLRPEYYPDEFLTINKVYDVIHTQSSNHYYIKTNQGMKLYVHHHGFIPIQEHRKQQINKIFI